MNRLLVTCLLVLVALGVVCAQAESSVAANLGDIPEVK